MKHDRIILRGTARELSKEELQIVSGGEEVPIDGGGGDNPGGDGGGGYGGGDDGGSGAGVTPGQPTQKLSSQDPNGPMDEDKSALDWG